MAIVEDLLDAHSALLMIPVPLDVKLCEWKLLLTISCTGVCVEITYIHNPHISRVKAWIQEAAILCALQVKQSRPLALNSR